MLRIAAALLLTLVSVVPALAGGSSVSDPKWIWLGEKAESNQTVFFRKPFVVGETVTAARLCATCDNQMIIYLNGKEVLRSDTWESPVAADVTQELKKGTNVLAVRAKNEGSAAGLIVMLDIEGAEKKHRLISSDATWRTAEKAAKGWQQVAFDDKAWSSATVIGKLGDGPWKQITKATLTGAAKQKEQVATFLDQLKVAKDFKCELVYSVPGNQGSWVSMTTDPKGRLIVSDQYGKMYRVTLPGMGQAQAANVESIPVDIGEAQGLLWAFDSLYVVVNKHQGKFASGLYRVKDTDGDDKLDSVEELRKIPGGGEHGPHAVLLHPDKKSLVVVAGNHTNLPKIDNYVAPKLWGEHFLLPRMWDASGHAVGILAPGGWFCKTDPDGKKWEVFSTGFRNQYDAAYNRDGELFTYDSDMEWDMNMPWYRPTRICHCVDGSDFGWRSGTGLYPNYYPDNLPPVVDIGPGSPTGVTFGYGAKFPAKYQDALFVCDWSYGKLYAVHLTPDGASYKGQAEEFIRGTPLPLTDIVINPKDGAMYFAVGGRKSKSGLYRVTYTGKESTAPAQGDNKGADARAERKKLEAYLAHKDPKAIAIAWPYLGHKDRFLRWAARTALEHQDTNLWHDKALAEKDTQAALTALLGVVRTAAKAEQGKLLEALDRIEWKSLNHANKLELLRIYGLAFVLLGPADADTRARLIQKFDPHYPTNNLELNAELCKMLVYLQAPNAAAKSMGLLAKALTQEEQIEYALHLKNLKTGWSQKQHEDYFKWFLKAAGYKGGNSFTGFIKNIRKDAIDNLSAGEKLALKPILDKELNTANPVVAPPRPFVKKWSVDEVVALGKKGLKNRDFDKGRLMFAATNCFACHRFAQEGGAYGPDLTGVAGRYSLQDLVENIIEPSKVISDQYEAVFITLNNGQTVQGRVVNIFGDNISINLDMLNPNKLMNVNRNQIDTIIPSKISMMPTGLLDTLHEDEVLDLVAYLLSGGDRNHAAFAKKD